VRIGINVDGGSRLDELLAQVRGAAELGYSTAWLSQSPGGGPRGRSGRGSRHQVFGYDPLTAFAVASQQVNAIEFGTNIIATYPRHPMVLAEQVLTLAAASTAPVVLGLGVSHRHAVEDQWGYSYDRSALRMREYLQVLDALLSTGAVWFEGQTVTARGSLLIDGAPVPTLVAALGPQMLRVAGENADGAITWMAGMRTLAGHIRPRLDKAAASAGRATPRLVAMMPVCITSCPDAARALARHKYLVYRTLPNYRAVLEMEGAEDCADIAMVGDEETVAGQLTRLAEAGADDLCAMIFGSPEEMELTRSLLPGLSCAA
jgi:5,10-methylenetetrahydromethanopterin reductase